MDLESKQAAVLKMINRGYSQAAIIKALGVSHTFIWCTKKVFMETGSTSRRPGQGHKRTARTPQLVKALSAKIRRNPACSMNRLAEEHNVSRVTMQRVVKEDLRMQPYKHQKKQLLSEATRNKKKGQSQELLNWYAEHPEVVVIFSDEKLFETVKKLNRQNDHILARSPASIAPGARNVYRMQKPLSVMTWGAIASNGKKSPLFRIPDGVKINKETYLAFLEDKVLPWILEELPGVPIWFQQDGAPAHIGKIVQAWCKDNFRQFWPKELWPPSSLCHVGNGQEEGQCCPKAQQGHAHGCCRANMGCCPRGSGVCQLHQHGQEVEGCGLFKRWPFWIIFEYVNVYTLLNSFVWKSFFLNLVIEETCFLFHVSLI